MKKSTDKIDNYLKHKIANNDFEVDFDELKELGLDYEAEEIPINENVLLERKYLFKLFQITIKDSKRNYENKLLDTYIDKNSVINALSDYKLTTSKYNKFKKNVQAEVEWTKDLEAHLKKYFQTVKRGSPKKSLEIDIDLGSGKVGIELKWADKINKNNPMNSVYGQIAGYHRNGNYKSLFLLVAGKKELKQNAFILQLENLVNNTTGCRFNYMIIS
jgi:hypothetical protein